MADNPRRLFKIAKVLLTVYHKVKRCCFTSVAMRVASCEIVRSVLDDGERVAYEHPRLTGNGLEVDAVILDYREHPPVKHKARFRRKTRGSRDQGSSRRF